MTASLEIHDREVGAAERRSHRAEHCPGAGEERRAYVALEVDVAGEGERYGRRDGRARRGGLRGGRRVGTSLDHDRGEGRGKYT